MIRLIYIFFSIANLYFANAQNTGEIKHIKSKTGTEVGFFLNNRKEGSWVYYSKSNHLRKICFYKEGLLEGKYLLFDTKGNISLSLTFIHGSLNGDVNFYSHDGKLLAVYNYHNDILNEIKFYLLNDESPPRNHDFVPNYDPDRSDM
jgi:antitoxin component YwqK of YwqJK toxin-antitoxin module